MRRFVNAFFLCVSVTLVGAVFQAEDLSSVWILEDSFKLQQRSLCVSMDVAKEYLSVNEFERYQERIYAVEVSQQAIGGQDQDSYYEILGDIVLALRSKEGTAQVLRKLNSLAQAVGSMNRVVSKAVYSATCTEVGEEEFLKQFTQARLQVEGLLAECEGLHAVAMKE